MPFKEASEMDSASLKILCDTLLALLGLLMAQSQKSDRTGARSDLESGLSSDALNRAKTEIEKFRSSLN